MEDQSKEDKPSKPSKNDKTPLTFEAGDHVIRWKFVALLMWPIQIHGIVLAVDVVGGGIIVADFGWTSTPQDTIEDDQEENNKNEAIMKALKALRPDGHRFSIITLTEPKEVNKWTKVNYGASMFSKKSKSFGKMTSWFSSFKKNGEKGRDDDTISDSESIGNMSADSSMETIDKKIYSNDGKMYHSTAKPSSISKFFESSKKTLGKSSFFSGKTHSDKGNVSCDSSETESITDGKAQSPQEQPQQAKLPKSDPHRIVLARVNFVLSQDDLPDEESSLCPYHMLYSNSECLAVWCKTGKFSTLQASVYLHATAVANAKSTFALGTTMAITQPWLIPAIAGYGIVGVGMPYYFLKKCHDKWKKSEMKLNNGFWARASHDVFITAIESWSNLVDKDESVS